MTYTLEILKNCVWHQLGAYARAMDAMRSAPTGYQSRVIADGKVIATRADGVKKTWDIGV